MLNGKKIETLEDYILHELKRNEHRATRSFHEHLFDAIVNPAEPIIDRFGFKVRDYSFLKDPYSVDRSNNVIGYEMLTRKVEQHLGSVANGTGESRFLIFYGLVGSGKTSFLELFVKSVEDHFRKEKNALYVPVFKVLYEMRNAVVETKNDLISDQKFVCYAEPNPILVLPREIRKEFLNLLGVNTKDILPAYLDKDACSECMEMYIRLSEFYEEKDSSNEMDIAKIISKEHLFVKKRKVKGGTRNGGILRIDANTGASTQAGGELSLRLIRNYKIDGEDINLLGLSKDPLATSFLIICDDSKTLERYLEDLGGIVSDQTYRPMLGIGTTARETIIMCSTNEPLDPGKVHPKIFSRALLNPVPYNIRYSDERKIYEKQIDKLREKGYYVDPDVLDVISMISVSSRIYKPEPSSNKDHYNKYNLDDKQGTMISNLKPINKLLLLAGEKDQLRKELKDDFALVTNEFVQALYQEYELKQWNQKNADGFVGIEPRGVIDIIKEMQYLDNKYIMSFNVLEWLLENPSPSIRDKLYFGNQEIKSGEYRNIPMLIGGVKRFYNDKIFQRFINCFAEIDEVSTKKDIEKYIGLLKEYHSQGELTGRSETSKIYQQDFGGNFVNIKEELDRLHNKVFEIEESDKQIYKKLIDVDSKVTYGTISYAEEIERANKPIVEKMLWDCAYQSKIREMATPQKGTQQKSMVVILDELRSDIHEHLGRNESYAYKQPILKQRIFTKLGDIGYRNDEGKDEYERYYPAVLIAYHILKEMGKEFYEKIGLQIKK